MKKCELKLVKSRDKNARPNKYHENIYVQGRGMLSYSVGEVAEAEVPGQ